MVSVAIAAGETLGFAGESGCGADDGPCDLALLGPSAGHVTFDNLAHTTFVATLREAARCGSEVPYASRDPRTTVEDMVAEPLRTFQTLSAPQIVMRVSELLDEVCLDARLRKRFLGVAPADSDRAASSLHRLRISS